MHRIRRERRQAYRDVLGALGRGVAHPFAAADEHRLAGAHLERSVLALDANRPGEHDGVLVEPRALARLRPSRGGAHPRHAHPLLAALRARPANSSIVLGGSLAASTCTGDSISSGIGRSLVRAMTYLTHHA